MTSRKRQRTYRMSPYKRRYKKQKRMGSRMQVRNKRTAGFLGIELKFQDSETDQAVGTGVDNNARADPTSKLSLNSIAIGNAPDQRDGRHVRLHSLNIKGMINFTADSGTVPPTTGFVNIYLVRDKQTNGAQIVPSEVFHNPANAEMDHSPMLRLENISRFQIIKKLTVYKHYPVAIWNGSLTKTNGVNQPFSMYCKVSDDVHFSATTAEIGSIADVSYHLIVIGTANLLATLNYTSRVRFYG